MTEENGNPPSNEEVEIREAVNDTNFSNELHQLQDSLFKDAEAPEAQTNSPEPDPTQIIQISPETDEDNQEQEKQQQSEAPEKKIEVFNNIAGLNQPNLFTQRPTNVPIRQRIVNWYSSLEKRVGEAEAKELLVVFIRNAGAFVVGSFFVSTIAKFIDDLK